MFSREYTHKDYCLAHLFTDLKFEGGILGLAYVGSPRRNSVGGICTPGELNDHIVVGMVPTRRIPTHLFIVFRMHLVDLKFLICFAMFTFILFFYLKLSRDGCLDR